MENKAFVRLMLLFLGFSYLLLSCVAVPTTRSLKSNKEPLLSSFSVQDLLPQDEMKLSEAEEFLGVEDVSKEERMLMESTDYPGPGANKNHDPKTPGRA
ncbi:hypothetical protein PTKIN_Ptkin06aG0148600 [Pterospermum kingtungense]